MSGSVKEVTKETFQAAVIDRSYEVPVIVDFWAAWCGPCKTLTPILEAAVAQHPGKVDLAKIDCDREPGLAASFNVSGIPAVKAVVRGQIVNEFTGAQPAHVVESWVRGLVPTAEEDLVTQARRLAEQGGREQAIERLRGFLAQHPADPPVALELGRQLSLAERPAEALAALDLIPDGAPEFERATQERLLLEMLAAAQAAGGYAPALQAVADRPNAAARFALAGARWQAGDAEGAVTELLQIVRTDRAFRDDGARRTLLAIFDHLGAEHPVTQQGRAGLAMILFA